MRREEQYAANSFLKYLEEKHYQASYRLGDNPPDICFNINNALWAVEITRLVQYVDNNGEEESRIGSEKRLSRLIDVIDQETASIRKSGYIIALNGILTKEQEKSVSNEIIKSISSNQFDLNRLHKIRKYCYVKQTDDTERKIIKSVMVEGVAKLPGSDKIIADIQETINYSISRILKKKIPILDKLTNFKKRILLILSYDYPFADDFNVGKAIKKQSNNIKGIDEIYLIDINKKISLLYPNP